jgi:hypothetical protein
MSVSVITNGRPELWAEEFLERLENYWGRNGYAAAADDRTFCGACPSCKSKSHPAGHRRYPLVIVAANAPARWDLSATCGCSEQAIYDALDGPPDDVTLATDDPRAWLDGAPMDPAAVSADPLPTVPGFPFLHPATAAVISGPTGAGRSSLIQACAYDAGRAGVRVAYLGSEVTEPEFNARAADLARRRGDEVDEPLRAQLANVRYLNLASTVAHAWQSPEEWVREAAKRFDVVAIDPLSAVASAIDLDFDKSNAEFVRFYDRLVQPLTGAGATVVMLENIGHSVDARARAKGVSAKQDRADLTFSCSLRTTPASLVVTARKVRTVRAAFERGDEWVFARETQRITRREGHDGDHDAGWRPTYLMERLSQAIEAGPGQTTGALLRNTKGKDAHLGEALKQLVADEYVRVEPGPRNAQLHYSARPYREEDE